MATIEQQLTERFVGILKKYQAELNSLKNSPEAQDLSNLFLSFFPENYENAKNKIMIVGRETKSWIKGKHFERYDEEAVKDLMNATKKHFWGQIIKTKNDQGFSFFNFIREVAKHSGQDGIVYGNAFAISYQKSHPKYSRHHFKFIEAISGELLNATIAVLKPEIVILATGRIKAREKYFPKPETDHHFKKTHPFYVNNLWKFKVKEYESTIFYRINHPSAFGKKHQAIREYLIHHLLPLNCQTKCNDLEK